MKPENSIDTAAPAVKTVGSWFKNIWNKVDFDKWAKELGDSSSTAIQAALYFVLGFTIGFLFRKYLKVVLTCILLSLILVKVLEYNGVLEIDWDAVKTLFGFSPAAEWGAILDFYLAWIKARIVLVISGLVGFFIGYKLG